MLGTAHLQVRHAGYELLQPAAEGLHLVARLRQSQQAVSMRIVSSILLCIGAQVLQDSKRQKGPCA